VTSERYVTGLARAFGNAILFGIPLVMEMWSLGFPMSRGRLLLVAFTLTVLVGFSYFSGSREPSA
jgi:hypothetical protein